MLFGFSFFPLEFAVIVFCLLVLAAGLVRITAKRQMEVLKDYLQPEKLPIEQLIMRAEKTPASQVAEHAPTTDTAAEPPTSPGQSTESSE